jgi:hypothetical protein
VKGGGGLKRLEVLGCQDDIEWRFVAGDVGVDCKMFYQVFDERTFFPHGLHLFFDKQSEMFFEEG